MLKRRKAKPAGRVTPPLAVGDDEPEVSKGTAAVIRHSKNKQKTKGKNGKASSVDVASGRDDDGSNENVEVQLKKIKRKNSKS